MTSSEPVSTKPIHGQPEPAWKRLKLLGVPPVPCDYAVGDLVTYTNDAGLKFPMQVIGFSDPATNSRGSFIHLCREGWAPDSGAWWFAHVPADLTPRAPGSGRSPEFTAYATAHGRTPEAQLEHDTKRWPGGKMAGFLLWMSDALREFKAAHPEACVGHGIVDQDAKIRFLNARAVAGVKLSPP